MADPLNPIEALELPEDNVLTSVPAQSDLQKGLAAQAAEKERAELDPGLLAGSTIAMESEQITPLLVKGLNLSGSPADPDFAMTPEFLEELGEGLPTETLTAFDGAHSQEHAQYIRSQLLTQQESEKQLQAMGWTGVGLRVGAAIADPVALGAVLFTQGAAAPFIAAGKAGRVGRAIRFGLVGSAEAGAIESSLVALDQGTRSPTDILYAMVGGGLLGGGIGAAIPGRKAISDEIIRKEIAESGGTLSEKGVKVLSADQGPMTGTSAADTPFGRAEPLSEDAAKLAAEFENEPVAAFAAIRFDMRARVGASENGVVRGLANSLAPESVGFKNGGVQGETASEWASRQNKIWELDLEKVVRPHREEYLKGVAVGQRRKARETFETEAFRTADTQIKHADERINAYANALTKQNSEILQALKKAEVDGFAEVKDLPYMTRMPSTDKIGRLVDDLGASQTRAVIKNAFMAANADAGEELAEKVAAAYLKTLRKVRVGEELKFVVRGGKDMGDLLGDHLSETTDMSAADIEDILGFLSTQDKGGVSARAKRRTPLDTSVQTAVVSRAEGQKNVSMQDFFDTDAQFVQQRYIRQASGLVAAAKKGFKSDADFETMLRAARTEADLGGEKAVKRLAKEEQILRLMYNHTLGRPLKNLTATEKEFATVLRTVRNWNFARVMNQVGFAQIAEFGNLVGIAGVRATVKAMPAMRDIIKRGKDGTFNNELMQELDSFHAMGSDLFRQNSRFRLDDFDNATERNLGTGFNQRAGEFSKKAKDATAKWSGFQGVTQIEERLALAAISHRFGKAAKNGKMAWSKRRLASAGLEQSDADDIAAQINKHTSFETGVLGTRVKRFNMEKWDENVRDKFILAQERLMRRVVQETDPHDLAMWMTSDLGRIVIQFRSFMLAAWNKQLLHNVHAMDFNSFSLMMFSSVFAAAGWTGQQVAKSALMPEDRRKEFLAQRITPEEIGKQAFARSAWSSMIPMMIDQGMLAAGEESPFGYSRSTGLDTNAFYGNPTTALLDTGAAAISGVGSAALGDDFSKQDMRKVTDLIVFQNYLGMETLLRDWLPRGLGLEREQQ